MKAAVIRAFGSPPAYEDFELPALADEDEVVIDVLAVGLHPRTRSGADGSHYTSTGQLPMIPGIDGVGRSPDGRLRYFVLHDTPLGSMAEQVVIDGRRSVVLPDDTDVLRVAAAMNPAMASWMAFRRRIDLPSGASVLVLGATGNAGQLAVPIAKQLGAAHVVAAGRDAARLSSLADLGADVVVPLEEVGTAAADVDVVLDFLWGEATQAAMPALLTARSDRGRRLQWVEVGSMAGLELTLPSAWLRAARIELVGSGQGSVPTRDILAELPTLAAEISSDRYAIDVVETRLAEITSTWTNPVPTGRRVVVVPQLN